MKRSEANWICHILCRNCFLKHIIEGKIEGRIAVKGRRGRRSKQLMDELNETGGYSKLNLEVPDHTLWGNGFGTAYGPVLTENAGRMNE